MNQSAPKEFTPGVPSEQAPRAEQPIGVKPQEQYQEQPKTPETIPELAPSIEAEQTREQIREEPDMITEEEGFLDETIDALKQKLRRKKPKPTTIPQVRDEVTIKIEKIMEAELEDAYRELSTVEQQEFKLKGEQTAMAIRQMFTSARVKFSQILKLILEWLKLLPGINIFFLEQEAKIKTDRIIELQKQVKK